MDPKSEEKSPFLHPGLNLDHLARSQAPCRLSYLAHYKNNNNNNITIIIILIHYYCPIIIIIVIIIVL